MMIAPCTSSQAYIPPQPGIMIMKNPNLKLGHVDRYQILSSFKYTYLLPYPSTPALQHLTMAPSEFSLRLQKGIPYWHSNQSITTDAFDRNCRGLCTTHSRRNLHYHQGVKQYIPAHRIRHPPRWHAFPTRCRTQEHLGGRGGDRHPRHRAPLHPEGSTN